MPPFLKNVMGDGVLCLCDQCRERLLCLCFGVFLSSTAGFQLTVKQTLDVSVRVSFQKELGKAARISVSGAAQVWGGVAALFPAVTLLVTASTAILICSSGKEGGAGKARRWL